MKLKERLDSFLVKVKVDMCLSNLVSGSQIKYRVFDEKSAAGEIIDFPYNFREVPTTEAVYSFAKDHFGESRRVDLYVLANGSDEVLGHFNIFKSTS